MDREMETLMKSGLIALALLAAGPTLSGYAWALGWLPVYGSACQYNRIFGRAITPDGYRVFLLGYGCDIDAAVRQIVAASEFSRSPKDTSEPPDPGRIIAIYHGVQRADSSEESLTTDIVQQRLREFAVSTPESNCSPGEYCGIPDHSSDTIIAHWIGAYLSFGQSHFLDAVDDGADYISWMLRLGPIFQGLTCVLYAIVSLTIVRLIITVAVTIVKRWQSPKMH
jgi:hypothetical protein